MGAIRLRPFGFENHRFDGKARPDDAHQRVGKTSRDRGGIDVAASFDGSSWTGLPRSFPYRPEEALHGPSHWAPLRAIRRPSSARYLGRFVYRKRTQRKARTHGPGFLEVSNVGDLYASRSTSTVLALCRTRNIMPWRRPNIWAALRIRSSGTL